MKNKLLNNEQIKHKIRRIAYQIYENNSDKSQLILAGITGNGYALAKKINETLQQISAIEIVLCEVFIDKKNPLNPITTSIPLTAIENQSLVLVDDVLNTGKTLIYGVSHFLQIPLQQFKTAVLIDRNHKKYPVKADFKGLSLSTTVQNYILVEIENDNFTYYLS